MDARQRNCQFGVVSAIAVILLAVVIMMVLLMAIEISTTGVNDTLNQSDSVAALFLAESGLENATQRLAAGTAACDATLAASVSGIGRGGFSVQSGLSTDYDGVTALEADQCRVNVSATITRSNVSRSIEGIVQTGSGGGGISLDNKDSRDRNNQDSLSWNFTVSGNDRLLLVGVSLRRDNNQVVTALTYGGNGLSFIGAINNDPEIRVELWYLVAPPLGSNAVSVTLSNNGRFVVGVASISGVDQSTPVELPASFNTGQGIFAIVPVTTVSDNAWVVDVFGAQSHSGPVMGFGKTQLWNEPSPGNPRIQGAGSYMGPLSPAQTVNMWWLTAYTQWAAGAVALRPAATSASLLSWREVVQ